MRSIDTHILYLSRHTYSISLVSLTLFPSIYFHPSFCILKLFLSCYLHTFSPSISIHACFYIDIQGPKGGGLGLVVSKQIIKLHGGEVIMKSKGTYVRVRVSVSHPLPDKRKVEKTNETKPLLLSYIHGN